MAHRRKRHRTHRKHHRRSSGIHGFNFTSPSTQAITDYVVAGVGALGAEFAISKGPWPDQEVDAATKKPSGIPWEKLTGLKAVVAGVGVKMLMPKSREAHTAAIVAVGVGIGHLVKGFGFIEGLQGFNDMNGLQGNDPLENLSGSGDGSGLYYENVGEIEGADYAYSVNGEEDGDY